VSGTVVATRGSATSKSAIAKRLPKRRFQRYYSRATAALLAVIALGGLAGVLIVQVVVPLAVDAATLESLEAAPT
jgi:hypothetical protein